MAKSCAKAFSKFLVPGEEHQSRVMEGFEPQTVAEEVSAQHFVTIIDTILKDYAPPQKFSDAFARDFKAYIKELFGEVSEGLYDGVNDLEQILKSRLQREISNVNAGGMEGMLISMVWPQIWQKILRIYQGEPAVNIYYFNN